MHSLKHISRFRPLKAFTIMEVLIAVMIIGILAVILVPVLLNRMAEAKTAKATRDMEEIVEAQKRVAIHTGYYVRIFMLDDVAGGNGVPLQDGDSYDGIEDEDEQIGSATAYYDNRDQLFIDPSTGDLLSPAASEAVFQTITVGDNNTTRTAKWGGPYYTIHSDEDNITQPGDHNPTPAQGFPTLHDIPTDPWGNDYLFFTRLGMIKEPEGLLVEPEVIVDSVSYDTTEFDRPTILSLGPDGLPGGEGDRRFGRGDDQFRSFEY
ncbi:MAG: type II secretion system protein [Candidatus Sumerlaeia bacterium]